MITPELKVKRMRNVITASQLYHIMGDYDDPKPKPPKRDTPNFELLYKVIKPDYDKGTRMFYVKELSEAVGDKVSAADRDNVLSALKYDAPAEIPSTIITYARQRVRQQFFNDPAYDDVDTFAMREGREREPKAILKLEEATGLSFFHTGENQLHESRDGVGSTPDGMAVDSLDLWHCGAEVKSFGPDHHIDCWLLEDQQQIREQEFEIYCQCQGGMHAFELPRWKAGFYNPHTERRELVFHHLDIEPDPLFVTVMLERVELARKAIDDRVNEIWDQIAKRRQSKTDMAA